ncbi:MAG: hypothetical protein HOE90_14700 [Bacteriovoracaceae bacterium]|jgi:hypothetical protein|nr:hypothetical protein [Bacteriovoracaceae bacterium]
MEDKKLSTENYNYCYYQLGELKAFVSMGAEAEMVESGPNWLYFSTLAQVEGLDLNQSTFKALEDALAYTNQKFKDWNFIDLADVSDQGGCSSCGNQKSH